MYQISVCLSDLPKDKMKKPANGKVYINLIVADRREPDQYGNDLTVFVSQSKEEREAKADKIYCGQGKKLQQQTAPSAEQIEAAPGVSEEETNDLPF